MGVVRAMFEVRASNDPVRRFYEGFGFRATAVRKQYYTNPVEDALILWRDPENPANAANTVIGTGD